MTDLSKNVVAVVLAAGKGVRMKSDLPKVLHNIDSKPMITYLAETLTAMSFSKVIFVVGYKREMVKDALKDYDCDFAVQSEQLGTGHAVMMTGDLIGDFDGDTLVLNGDVPFMSKVTLEKLIIEHINRKAVATVLTSVPPDPSGYGRIIRSSDGLVERIVEHKDANEDELKVDEINTGTFIFKNRELFAGLKMLKNDNSQGEYYITDLMEIFLRQGKITAAFKASDYRETLGINSKEQLENLKQAYKI